MNVPDAFEEVRRFVRSGATDAPSSLTLQRSLSEAWFSNTLAWLLDPRGSHRLGVRFAEAFTALIGERRAACNGAYARRASFLKAGRRGKGMGASGFRFGNASVLREFHLSKSHLRDGSEGMYCDLVLLDLDIDDSIFLVVENKLFMPPRGEQLLEYYNAVEAKYDRVSVREFVLLTLRGNEFFALPSEVARNWMRLSWTVDVRHLLNAAAPTQGSGGRSALASLRRLLDWLAQVTDPAALSDASREAFRDLLLRSSAECLQEELSRLHAHTGGRWVDPEPSGAAITLRHSTHRVSDVVVALLPGLSVGVHGHSADGRPTFDKIIVPFGAPPAQVFNLLDLAARDIYRWHLPPTRRGDARWRPVNRGERKVAHRRLFTFVHRHQQLLRPLLYRTCTSVAP